MPRRPPPPAIRSVLLLAALLAFAERAEGAERWLQNDSFAGSATAAVTVPEITLNEGYAARFSAAPDEYPVQLRKLQFVFVTNPTHGGTDCGLFWLRIYADPGGSAAPGELLFDSETTGEGLPFEIAGNSSSMQELDLADVPGFPLPIAGDFRVELRAEDDTCVSVFGNDHLPLLYVDADATPGRNFLWGYPTPGASPAWFDTATLGVQGDFVLRAYVTTSGVAPPPDVVTPDVVTPDTVTPPVDTVTPPVDTATPPADTATPPADTAGEDDTGAVAPDAAAPPDTGPGPGGDLGPGADRTVAGLAVTGVVPASAPADRATDIRILGAGFAPGVMVTLDADPLAVTDVGPQRISARVPSGLTPGVKSILVENPDGDVALLEDAFTVEAAGGGGADGAGDASGGCAAAPTAVTPGALTALAALLLAALAVHRRRRRPGERARATSS